MDSIHYAMCLDYRISPKVFQQIEDLVNSYSHENFNFYLEPIPFGIKITAEEFIKSKGKFHCLQCITEREINTLRKKNQLENMIQCVIRHLIEEINQRKLLKI